jgi:hypothetical protein
MASKRKTIVAAVKVLVTPGQKSTDHKASVRLFGMDPRPPVGPLCRPIPAVFTGSGRAAGPHAPFRQLSRPTGLRVPPGPANRARHHSAPPAAFTFRQHGLNLPERASDYSAKSTTVSAAHCGTPQTGRSSRACPRPCQSPVTCPPISATWRSYPRGRRR